MNATLTSQLCLKFLLPQCEQNYVKYQTLVIFTTGHNPDSKILVISEYFETRWSVSTWMTV